MAQFAQRDWPGSSETEKQLLELILSRQVQSLGEREEPFKTAFFWTCTSACPVMRQLRHPPLCLYPDGLGPPYRKLNSSQNATSSSRQPPETPRGDAPSASEVLCDFLDVIYSVFRFITPFTGLKSVMWTLSFAAALPHSTAVSEEEDVLSVAACSEMLLFLPEQEQNVTLSVV